MTNINKLKTSACIIFALLVLVLLRSPSHAYSTTTTWTHNGQAVQTIETCQETTYTEYITARVDVSHILAKLTRQEAEYLRQFFNAEASCGEYPTHTAPVTKK